MSEPGSETTAHGSPAPAEPETTPPTPADATPRAGFNPPLIAGLVVASLVAWLVGWAALSPTMPGAGPNSTVITLAPLPAAPESPPPTGTETNTVPASPETKPAPPAAAIDAKAAPGPTPPAPATGAAPATAAPAAAKPDTPTAGTPAAAPVAASTPTSVPTVPTAAAPAAPPAAVGAPAPTPPAAGERTAMVTPARPAPAAKPPVADGAKAWQVHGRPFADPEKRPRIAVVMTGLGLSANATRAAIELPGEVTLAFVPYARRLDEWVALARASGHEVLVDMPMEPVGFPAQDPGPQALLTSLTPGENIGRMDWALGRAIGFVGIVNQMGSKFTESAQHLTPVMETLRDRGLVFVDSRSSINSVAARVATALSVPRAINDRFIDNEASRDAIDEQLSGLEATARRGEAAVGLTRPYPVTMERLGAWLKTLSAKGLAAAPITAVVDRQADR